VRMGNRIRKSETQINEPIGRDGVMVARGLVEFRERNLIQIAFNLGSIPSMLILANHFNWSQFTNMSQVAANK
jgi:hypothetical protein